MIIHPSHATLIPDLGEDEASILGQVNFVPSLGIQTFSFLPFVWQEIKLLESPIPTAAPPSQKAHFDNISGTKRGTIDPLVSKRPEKF